MRRSRRSYREVLGVRDDAAPAEVKRAYRDLAKALHPDRVRDPDRAREAEDRLKEINAAWQDYLETVGRAPSAAGREADTMDRATAPPRPHDAAERTDADPPSYEAPPWRQRRPGRSTRDRYRAERARASRDREDRERKAREEADRVRRARDAEVLERAAYDRARAVGVVGIAVAGLVAAIVLVLLLVALFRATGAAG